jgi:hypothetical protein
MTSNMNDHRQYFTIGFKHEFCRLHDAMLEALKRHGITPHIRPPMVAYSDGVNRGTIALHGTCDYRNSGRPYPDREYASWYEERQGRDERKSSIEALNALPENAPIDDIMTALGRERVKNEPTIVPDHYVNLFVIPEEPIDPHMLAEAEKLVRAGYTFHRNPIDVIEIEGDPDAKSYKLTSEQMRVFGAALVKVKAESEFGVGSEMSRMMAIALDPNPLATAERRIAQEAERAFERATKVNAVDYSGWVSWPGHGNDGFFESVDAVRKHCAQHGLALPPFVWACTREPLSLNADWILDDALQEHHDGARGEVSSDEERRLQKFLDEWCAAQEIVSWNEDRTRAVMLQVEGNKPCTRS